MSLYLGLSAISAANARFYIKLPSIEAALHKGTEAVSRFFNPRPSDPSAPRHRFIFIRHKMQARSMPEDVLQDVTRNLLNLSALREVNARLEAHPAPGDHSTPPSTSRLPPARLSTPVFSRATGARNDPVVRCSRRASTKRRPPLPASYRPDSKPRFRIAAKLTTERVTSTTPDVPVHIAEKKRIVRKKTVRTPAQIVHDVAESSPSHASDADPEGYEVDHFGNALYPTTPSFPVLEPDYTNCYMGPLPYMDPVSLHNYLEIQRRLIFYRSLRRFQEEACQWNEDRERE